MTTIAQIDAFNIRVPLIKEFSTSNKTSDAAKVLLVRVAADDGSVGWGEAPLNPTFTDETADSAVEALATVVEPNLIGRDVDEAMGRMPEVHRVLGARVGARCAVSVALWDLTARVCDVPLYVLLGGRRRTSVAVVYHIGNFDMAADAADARRAAAEGYTAVKLKVGRFDVNEDIEAVRQVRQAAGPQMRIYVDANEAWNRQQAAGFARQASAYGVSLVEQPLAKWDVKGIAELGATPGVTLAADEGVYDVSGLMGHLTSGSPPGGIVVKLLKAGGIEGAMDLLRLCSASAIVPFLAGMPGDTSVISAALLNVAVAAPELPLGTAITPHFSKQDVVSHPLRVVQGRLGLDQLQGPGLGIDVQLEGVESLRY